MSAPASCEEAVADELSLMRRLLPLAGARFLRPMRVNLLRRPA